MIAKGIDSANKLGCIASRINLTVLACLTLLLEPKLLTKFHMFNYLYIAGAVIVFCVVVVRLVHLNIRVSKFLISALLYRLFMLPQTILLGGELLDWGYYTLTFLALVGYFESLRSDRERLGAIDNVAFLLLIYLLLNCAVLLICRDGVVDGLYFLGYRTRIVEVLIAGIMASAYVDCWQGKMSFRTIVICAIGLIQILMLWVATALVGIGVFALTYFILSRVPRLNRPSLFHIITLLGVVATVAFCFFNASQLFAGFIQTYLHKTATLSDRTEIWAMAIQMIKASPLLGYGVVDNGNHILWVTGWSSMYWQAHNNILQILLDGGLLSFTAYFALLLYVGSTLCRKHLEGKMLSVVLSSWLALNVMGISEIFVLQNYYFLFLIVTLAACFDRRFINGERLGAQNEI